MIVLTWNLFPSDWLWLFSWKGSIEEILNPFIEADYDNLFCI